MGLIILTSRTGSEFFNNLGNGLLRPAQAPCAVVGGAQDEFVVPINSVKRKPNQVATRRPADPGIVCGCMSDARLIRHKLDSKDRGRRGHSWKDNKVTQSRRWQRD